MFIYFKKQIRKTEEVKSKITLDESMLGSVLKLIRDCNVTMHWILLHTAVPTFLIEDTKKSRSIRQMVIQESKYSANNGLRLLLSTAQIEHEVKQLYKQVSHFIRIILKLLFCKKMCAFEKIQNSTTGF